MSTRQMTLGTFRAELLKLRKRPALWILATVLLAAVGLFGYLVAYGMAAGDTELPGVDRDELLASLLPAQMVSTTLAQLAGFGAALALILGVLAVGSEYGWGTWKTLATQRPGRGTLLIGKFLALAAALAGLVGAALALGWVSSLVVASIEGESMRAPPLGELAAGIGAAWLILAAYAAFGALLSVASRSSGLALALGLVYVLVIENLLLTLPTPGRFADTFAQAGLGPNALALSRAFGEAPVGAQMIAVGAPDPGQASAVLAAYVLAFAIAGLVLFRRRPVT